MTACYATGGEERLRDGKRSEGERDDLQDEGDDRGHQPEQPHRAREQLDEQPRAEGRCERHLLGRALLGGAGQPDTGGAEHGRR
jgi:hypothetical protein